MLRRLYSFAITLRLPSVYVEIHFEFFVRSFVVEHPLTLLPGQNRSRSDCNVRSSNGRRRPKTMIVDETEGRGWMDPRWKRQGTDQRHESILCFFDFSIEGIYRCDATSFLIYLLFQKKTGWYRRAGDFRDSVVFVGIKFALTKGH